MRRQKLFIRGSPASQKSSGKPGPELEAWKAQVHVQSSDLKPVPGACDLRVDFRLPADKFANDNPFGPDIDNLLKPLLDGLKATLFRDHPEKVSDSCVMRVIAKKSRASAAKPPGAVLTVARFVGSVKDA